MLFLCQRIESGFPECVDCPIRLFRIVSCGPNGVHQLHFSVRCSRHSTTPLTTSQLLSLLQYRPTTVMKPLPLQKRNHPLSISRNRPLLSTLKLPRESQDPFFGSDRFFYLTVNQMIAFALLFACALAVSSKPILQFRENGVFDVLQVLLSTRPSLLVHGSSLW